MINADVVRDFSSKKTDAAAEASEDDKKYSPGIVVSESENVVLQRVIDVCEKGVATLQGFLDEEKDKRAWGQLNTFKKNVQEKLKNYSAEVRQSFMLTALKDFRFFCAHVKDLSKETRHNEILNLAQGLVDCVPGQDMNIVSAASNLRVLTVGIQQKFKNLLEELVKQHSLDFLRKNNIRFHKTYEIHYGAFLHNIVCKHLGLTEMVDKFMNESFKESSGIVKISKEQLDDFEKNIVENITAKSVIDCMAQEYLDGLRNFFVNKYPKDFTNRLSLSQVDEMFKDFEKNKQNELKNIFGHLGQEQIFLPCIGEEDCYRLVSDKDLIALQITKNLCAANIVESKAKYIIGEKGVGVKLKIRDNRYYLSETAAPDVEIIKNEIMGEIFNKNQEKVKNTHAYQSLEQFCWQDNQVGKKWLEQLAAQSSFEPVIKNIYEEFFEKTSANLVREMVDVIQTMEENEKQQSTQNTQAAPVPKEIDELFEQANLVLNTVEEKNRFLLKVLERARLAGKQKLINYFFAKLTPEQRGMDDLESNDALEFAMRYGQKELAWELVNELTPEKLILRNKDGNTALMSALIYGDITCATFLLQKMNIMQLCIKNNDDGVALSLTLKVLPEFFDRLMDRFRELHAKPEVYNIADKYNNPPLTAALRYKNPESALALIEILSSTQLSEPGEIDRTALINSIAFRQIEPAKALVRKLDGDQINQQDKEKMTALIFSLIRKYADIAKMIIKKLKPIHLMVQDAHGNTALIAAIKCGLPAIAKILIAAMDEEGLGLQDEGGNTAIHVALLHDELEIADLLAKKMSDAQLKTKNNLGQTARRIAEIRDHIRIQNHLYYRTHTFLEIFGPEDSWS